MWCEAEEKILILELGDNQENAVIYTVGEQSVTKIVEHRPAGEGDKWYYDVHIESGVIHRVFNPLSVTRESSRLDKGAK